MSLKMSLEFTESMLAHALENNRTYLMIMLRKYRQNFVPHTDYVIMVPPKYAPVCPVHPALPARYLGLPLVPYSKQTSAAQMMDEQDFCFIARRYGNEIES